MDDAELEKVLKSFWKAFKAGDSEKCESIYSEHREDEGFEGMVLRLNACIALEKEETREAADDLLWEYVDPETELLDEDGIQAFDDILMECYGKIADLGRSIPPVFFYDIDLDIERDMSPLTIFRQDDMVFNSIRRRLVDKMTDQKSPDKVNAYLGYITGTLEASFMIYGVGALRNDLVRFKSRIEPILGRKSMAGSTGYAELILYFVSEMADFLDKI